VTLALGDTVDVRMTKWGDRPHWSFVSLYLGDDEHGTWLGFPRGTHMTRNDWSRTCRRVQNRLQQLDLRTPSEPSESQSVGVTD